uniref:DNA polymerase II small subunit n=1 Tax=Archaeoglobus fulgidus TaxID=2234 RepID=A0A7C3ZCA8_ARCFL
MVIKNIDAATVAKKFLVRGYNIDPKAAELLCKSGIFSDEVVDRICRIANGGFIIEKSIVERFLENFSKPTPEPELKPKGSEVKSSCSSLKVIKDITGKSSCQGNVEDFLMYFNSRLEKLSRIIRSRMSITPIAYAGKVRGNVNVAGLVSEVYEKGEKCYIRLEDSTGIITCVATGKNAEIARELLGDEVIGVNGVIKGSSLYANRIIFPDIPINGNGEKKKDFFIVFLSDTHFGSKEFLEKEWRMFVNWLNGEVGGGRSQEVGEKVRYIIIAGDIVDGIGVYPGQEDDLEVKDIYGQYELAASHLEDIPKHIKVIISPGNHDAVRQAEPQPAFDGEIRNMFPKNVEHVGNPAYVDIEGVKVLIYHGRSLDDIISKIPRLSYDEPQKAMEELLKRRHLSPIYGERTPLAPEREDYLVIEDVPDILHCGHIHTYGTGFYRGVFMVNSSTWQAQTEFQKKVNLNPMPGNVAVYRPGGEVVRLRFYGE